MKGLRNSEFVVSLALLASLVGHFAIQRHFESRTRLLLQLAQAERAAGSISPLFSSSDNVPTPADIGLPSCLPDLPKDSHIVPALDVQADKAADPTGGSKPHPAPVPPPADADAASNESHGTAKPDDSLSAAVRSVIEAELSDSTREEREIWFEELKSVPPDVVRDLLNVRRQLHALPRLLGGIPEKLASTDTSTGAPPREISAETVSQKIRFNLPDQHSATSALEAAISQLRHNLMNASSPGFKRLRVTLVDAYGPAWQDSAPTAENTDLLPDGKFRGEGCRMAPLILDVTQGRLKKTERQYDLAIEGEGFFVVRQGEREFLTRCGAFTLDVDRQLVLSTTNENTVLQPPLRIPEDASEVQIAANGTVTMLKSPGSDLIEIGQLKIGKVASPSRLTPAGQALFTANEASGHVSVAAAMSEGLGEIQQGCLEQSNVDSEKELDEIEELSAILRSLPQPVSRPATARSATAPPH